MQIIKKINRLNILSILLSITIVVATILLAVFLDKTFFLIALFIVFLIALILFLIRYTLIKNMVNEKYQIKNKDQKDALEIINKRTKVLFWKTYIGKKDIFNQEKAWII